MKHYLRRWKRRVVFATVLVVLAVVGYLGGGAMLNGLADFLSSTDALEAPADVIIVLGGELEGERTLAAVELYKQGHAPVMLISDGTSLSWRTEAIEEMTDLARLQGVPEQAIYRETQSRSTYENALYTESILRKNGWDTATVVTTDWHTRRSALAFEEVYADSGIQLRYAGAADPRFDSLHEWWNDHEKTQVVLEEWAKLVVYFFKYKVFS